MGTGDDGGGNGGRRRTRADRSAMSMMDLSVEADDARLPTKEPREYVIPTVSQFQAIMQDLQTADCYLVILTCALLGCRIGEALGLYWEDIDFTKGTISFKRAYILNAISKKPGVGERKISNGRRTVQKIMCQPQKQQVVHKKRDRGMGRQLFYILPKIKDNGKNAL